MKEIVRMEGICKTYKGKIKALKNFSLNVFEGSIHAILGPNGAGKTTLLKILTGFVFPDRGRVYVDGNMAFLPEDKALYTNKRVRDMLFLSRRFFPYWNDESEKKLLRIFPLDMEKRVGELSYGTRTQLYLIILFAQDVPIYILDEPTMGLDPVVSETLLSLIKRVAVEGKTVIYSSHNLYEVEEIADTVTIIKEGKALYSGELDTLREEGKEGLKNSFLRFMEESTL